MWNWEGEPSATLVRDRLDDEGGSDLERGDGIVRFQDDQQYDCEAGVATIFAEKLDTNLIIMHCVCVLRSTFSNNVLQFRLP